MRESEPADIIFGKVLRELRLATGKSQEKFAMDSGLERTFISMLERGKRKPSIKTLISLARGLDISLTQMISVFEKRYFEVTGQRIIT